MEVINLSQFFETKYEAREEDLIPLPKIETEERYLDNYDEPMYFFKGVVYGLFFCLPLWTVLIWLIT
jgi:hypothetical protein